MRTLRSLPLLLVVASSLAVLPAAAPASADPWSPPGFVRSIGGNGEAGVYAWGMEYSPVTNHILVSDYWNYQIREYDLAGHEVNTFFRPVSVRKGQPYTIAVNRTTGDVYVPEWGDGKKFSGAIGHYDKNGVYLGEIKVPAAYHVWIHVDAQGYLWVADSHFWNNAGFPPKIRKFDVTDPAHPVEVLSFGTYGTGPGQLNMIHGLDTDDQGRLYAADALNRTVHVFNSQTGAWIQDLGQQGNAVGEFKGDLRGLVVDPVHDLLQVVDAEASQVETFDISDAGFGTSVGNWGSEGDGTGQFADGGREITVDATGDVWVTDFGHDRFFRTSPDGTLLNTFPDPEREAPVGFFSQVRDVAVDASGNVWGADSWNNRFQKFSATGAFVGAWGQRNSHPPYGMDYPRGIGIDPDTQRVWVANTRQHVIRVYEADGTYVFTIGDGEDSNDADSFRWPMDVEFYDGKAYVSDYYGTQLKILDASTGVLVDQVGLMYGPIKVPSTGVAVDPATGNIYILSWDLDRVYEYSPDGNTLIRYFGSTGTGDGQFQNPWDLDVIGGRLYVVDAKLSRISVFGLDGTFVGKWGAKGSKPFQYVQPSGITHDDAGNIYIADANNDRILVYNYAVPLPSGDAAKPTVTIASPLNNSLAPAQTLFVTGTATDNVGVGKVEFAVQNRVTGKWWNATLAIWQNTRVFGIAALSGAASTSVTYRFPFIGVNRGGDYTVQVRSMDTSNLLSPIRSVHVTMMS